MCLEPPSTCSPSQAFFSQGSPLLWRHTPRLRRLRTLERDRLSIVSAGIIGKMAHVNPISVYWDFQILLTDTTSVATIACTASVSCATATTISPAIKFCAWYGASAIPVTTAFDYGYWPIGGCQSDQLCWSANLLLIPQRLNANTWYKKLATNSLSSHVHLRRR